MVMFAWFHHFVELFAVAQIYYLNMAQLYQGFEGTIDGGQSGSLFASLAKPSIYILRAGKLFNLTEGV